MLKALRSLVRKLRRKAPQNFATYGSTEHASVPNDSYPWNSFNSATENRTSLQATGMLDLAQTVAVKAGKPIEDVRIEKKPVEVVSEIVAPEPVLRLNDIGEQIEIVEARLAVLKQFKGMTTDEVVALRYLRARRHYAKAKKKGLFPWAITTDALVSALVAKYKLQNVSFGLYSKSVPIEATQELAKFGDAWEYAVSDEDHTPELRLITDYQGPEHKKDPILLASSPFGRWWYILGAWDKEVEIVDEIIYKGK